MRLRRGGHFSGEESDLPSRDTSGCVQFEEPENMEKLAAFLAAFALPLTGLCLLAVWLRGGLRSFSLTGAVLSLAVLVPHELLHALWFRGDVWLYENISQGMLFVTGTEDFTRGRFIAMNLCPNLVFGIVPFVLFLINPSLRVLGTLGALSVPMGAGDYWNVFASLTQVPRGARIFMSGMHSFWYRPGAGGAKR